MARSRDHEPTRRAPPFDGDPAWRVTRKLVDGTEITIRPISPADRDELRRGFQAMSPESRYLRFLGTIGELSEAMLDYLTKVDQDDHVALVATVDSPDLKAERGIGVARFIRLDDEPDVAEAAITVVDDMQRRGVGTALARELERAAAVRGVRRFRAEVLADNAMMRSILESAGSRCHARGNGDGTLAYDVEIDASDAETLSEHLLRILRGAAETMALTIRRLMPLDEASGGAPATPEGRDAEGGDGDREAGARRPRRRT